MANIENNSDNNDDIIVDMRNTSSYFNKGDEIATKLVFIPKQFDSEINFDE